nr:AAA domain-containing protein [Streptomyces sp. TLI_235]
MTSTRTRRPTSPWPPTRNSGPSPSGCGPAAPWFVQGPPGTGKTHTIANLVTDLLAHGQRVLITSHTARALKVLKDKLPPSIRELCVSRTDDGLAAQQELRGSVQAILERQGGYDRRDYERRISDNEHRLRRARAAQATALTELRAIREQETYRHPQEIGDYRGTLQEIARRLADERARLGWLGPVPEAQPQVTGEQVRALRSAAARFGPAERAAVAAVEVLPAADDLPGAAAFEQAVLAVRSAEQGLAALRGNELADRMDAAVSRLPAGIQQSAAAALEAFAAARAGAEAVLLPWAEPLLQEALTGQVWQLRGRHAATAQALAGVRAATAALGGSRVDGLDGYDVAAAHGLVTALRDGLAGGEKLRGPLGMKTRLRKAVGDRGRSGGRRGGARRPPDGPGTGPQAGRGPPGLPARLPGRGHARPAAAGGRAGGARHAGRRRARGQPGDRPVHRVGDAEHRGAAGVAEFGPRPDAALERGRRALLVRGGARRAGAGSGAVHRGLTGPRHRRVSNCIAIVRSWA